MIWCYDKTHYRVTYDNNNLCQKYSGPVILKYNEVANLINIFWGPSASRVLSSPKAKEALPTDL